MKICLVISTLDCGGAERVASVLANEWAARGQNISIVTFDEAVSKPFYGLNPGVSLRKLGRGRLAGELAGKAAYNFKKILRLRRAVREIKPDIVISFMGQTNVTAVLALAGTGVPVIITEHIDNRMYSFGRVWDALMRLVYPFADSLVAVSKGVLDSLPAHMRRKGTVIYNPVRMDSLERLVPPENRPVRKIIAMGRLAEQKGFDLLLEAFSLVADKNPSWKVEVWGEGDLRGELEARRDRLGLKGRFDFPGITDRPFRQFANADIFALSSRYEGMVVVLCEAMAQGLPAVSFSCLSSPAEIIRDGVDGILVPPEDAGKFAEALDRLMNDEPLRRRMGERATEVRERFDAGNIIAQWDALIAKLLAARGRG